MEELIGFVMGNNNRQKLLSLLGSHGEMDSARIAKTMRIVPFAVDKLLSELTDKQLLVVNDGMYSLSETGSQVEKKIQFI